MFCPMQKDSPDTTLSKVYIKTNPNIPGYNTEFGKECQLLKTSIEDDGDWVGARPICLLVTICHANT